MIKPNKQSPIDHLQQEHGSHGGDGITNLNICSADNYGIGGSDLTRDKHKSSMSKGRSKKKGSTNI